MTNPSDDMCDDGCGVVPPSIKTMNDSQQQLVLIASKGRDQR